MKKKIFVVVIILAIITLVSGIVLLFLGKDSNASYVSVNLSKLDDIKTYGKDDFDNFLSDYQIQEPIDFLRKTNLGKYIKYIDIDMEGKELYKKIYKLVRGKNYFVITTNTDDQFFKTGFDKKKIFRVQGSYRLLQCSTPCHDKLYDAEDICNKLVQNIDKDLKVPSNLVPKCPKCGENMEVNLRKDGTFVQDSNWYSMANRYDKFLNDNKDKKVLFLEFGVGFNTPSIIRFPFEEMTSKNKNFTLIRFNKDSRCFYNMGCRFIEVREDLNKFFS